ncbi:conserved Plasmodium protein, unknown function [Plasmodium gallinaceum]|uniref:Uncharacterized protein n=1 Tax=Plasmodium gallinaceum TaxID=5849 RepID=A0A1J1GPG3_PLAGA|nr:conserved Plasmodium protein, unknown function [Plasmodium gallinaceum]CRG94196.1 conserved Plasmodium protein, unknown function [Plasmodium gallinaceum]
MLYYIIEQKKIRILCLVILYYFSFLITIQANANNYMLKIHEPLKKLKRGSTYKYDKRDVKNIMDFSFVSKNEVKEKDPHVEKEKKEDDKSLTLENEKKNKEKKNKDKKKEKKINLDEMEEHISEDEEEERDEEIDTIKKKGKEKDNRKDEEKNENKKKAKGDDEDEDEDEDEEEGEGEDEYDDEDDGEKKKKNENEKKNKDKKKGNESSEEHHEENNEKDKKKEKKEGEKNNPEGKENTENLKHDEQKSDIYPIITNGAQNMTPTLENNMQTKEEKITPEKDTKTNEDLHIPEDIKKNFMKLLRSVVEVNKNDLDKKENTHFREGEDKNHGVSPLHDKYNNGNELHNSLSLLNKIIEHFKKYMIYYAIGFIVFSVFALSLQCSD